jgi:hypothetical protein
VEAFSKVEENVCSIFGRFFEKFLVALHWRLSLSGHAAKLVIVETC